MALANRGQRSPRRSEQRSYLARLVCTFLEQLVATPDDLMNLRYALAAKRRLMPILTIYSLKLYSRERTVDSDIFTGLRHYSARVATCVRGVVEMD